MCVRVVCDNVVCERVVCDNVGCEELCVTMLCVQELCVTMSCVKELCVTMLCATMLWMAPSTKVHVSCHQVKRLPCHKKAHVHVTKCAPATQSARPCDQVPRLLRHKLRRQTRPSGPKRATRTVSAYACHAKCTWMAASTTPATQSERSCHQVPRLPRT